MLSISQYITHNFSVTLVCVKTPLACITTWKAYAPDTLCAGTSDTKKLVTVKKLASYNPQFTSSGSGEVWLNIRERGGRRGGGEERGDEGGERERGGGGGEEEEKGEGEGGEEGGRRGRCVCKPTKKKKGGK